MKLLVTGGAGFIGSNFILYWLKQHPQDQIVNLDNLTYAGNLENLKSVEKNSNYRFVKGDICNRQIVDELMQQVEIVVHFAAESHVDRSIMDASPFIKTNVLGTQVLLDSARSYNLRRFHHISTDEVFGSIAKGKFKETSPFEPNSPYAASKAGGDHLCRAYFQTYGVPTIVTHSCHFF